MYSHQNAAKMSQESRKDAAKPRRVWLQARSSTEEKKSFRYLKNQKYWISENTENNAKTCDSVRPPHWAGQCWADRVSTRFGFSSSARGSLPGFLETFEQTGSIWIYIFLVHVVLNKVWYMEFCYLLLLVSKNEKKNISNIFWRSCNVQLNQAGQRKVKTMGRIGYGPHRCAEKLFCLHLLFFCSFILSFFEGFLCFTCFEEGMLLQKDSCSISWKVQRRGRTRSSSHPRSEAENWGISHIQIFKYLIFNFEFLIFILFNIKLLDIKEEREDPFIFSSSIGSWKLRDETYLANLNF